jgi:hypothetical protein
MRVLFTGNSHTYANALPFQVRELLKREAPRTEGSMPATPGEAQAGHFQQPETQLALSCQR